jgi:hypothetical protein
MAYYFGVTRKRVVKRTRRHTKYCRTQENGEGGGFQPCRSLVNINVFRMKACREKDK